MGYTHGHRWSDEKIKQAVMKVATAYELERMPSRQECEIDKYAIQTTQHNFPNTIQLGDAFQVREEEWLLRK